MGFIQSGIWDWDLSRGEFRIGIYPEWNSGFIQSRIQDSDLSGVENGIGIYLEQNSGLGFFQSRIWDWDLFTEECRIGIYPEQDSGLGFIQGSSICQGLGEQTGQDLLGQDLLPRAVIGSQTGFHEGPQPLLPGMTFPAQPQIPAGTGIPNDSFPTLQHRERS